MSQAAIDCDRQQAIEMDFDNILAGTASLGLLVYSFFALLYPEKV
ncbi:MAG TPA: potassium-transporting ATPase subunit F [Drouetiella sp.]|jgi:F subunit of K+-transporting ATPase (Potass_KdpF)